MELNLIGPLIAMQEVIPIMKKQKEGSIINVSSGTALMAIPNLAGYSSTKRALVGLSLTANAELAKNNINVSVVYPYITATDFYKNTIGSNAIGDDRSSRSSVLQDADSAEYAAQKVIESIETEQPEVYAHDWMGKRD